eukprot:6204699-Pleurochrysis_carterae.AAC.1
MHASSAQIVSCACSLLHFRTCDFKLQDEPEAKGAASIYALGTWLEDWSRARRLLTLASAAN